MLALKRSKTQMKKKSDFFLYFRSWKTQPWGRKPKTRATFTFKVYTFRRKHTICRSPDPGEDKKPESNLCYSLSHFHWLEKFTGTTEEPQMLETVLL